MKRVRRFRKRTFRRKKRFYKRKFKKTQYDGIVYAKCHLRAPVTGDPITTTNASMGVHWGSSGTSGTKDMYIDDAPEFVSLVAVYQMWKLNGIKMKYVPIVETTSVSSSALYDV